jgi:hypothetical protein
MRAAGFACGAAAASSASAAGAAAMIAMIDNAKPDNCRARRGANDDSIKACDAV